MANPCDDYSWKVFNHPNFVDLHIKIATWSSLRVNGVDAVLRSDLFLTFYFFPPVGASTPNHAGYEFFFAPIAHTPSWSQTSRNMVRLLRGLHDLGQDDSWEVPWAQQAALELVEEFLLKDSAMEELNLPSCLSGGLPSCPPHCNPRPSRHGWKKHRRTPALLWLHFALQHS